MKPADDLHPPYRWLLLSGVCSIYFTFGLLVMSFPPTSGRDQGRPGSEPQCHGSGYWCLATYLHRDFPPPADNCWIASVCVEVCAGVTCNGSQWALACLCRGVWGRSGWLSRFLASGDHSYRLVHRKSLASGLLKSESDAWLSGSIALSRPMGGMALWSCPTRFLCLSLGLGERPFDRDGDGCISASGLVGDLGPWA
ncbi:MAG: hypothetical protein Ct9H300mP12_16640 [Acidimicrobiales bacterium]|nr:MAG: hypothetical protein Ct9H300mP12_16640 [Acidimicrobiales bacterium]